MQELLGRIAALDPQASLSLRVIACFDELIVGNVNTRGLLSAAASLAGCPAGFRHDAAPDDLVVSPQGEVVPHHPTAPAGASPPQHSIRCEDGTTVWLERDGGALANDAIILERLALAVRLRHGRARPEAAHRRELVLLLDGSIPVEDRRTAAASLRLLPGVRYRVVAAALFTVWDQHPRGVEDVVATPFGPIHAIVVPAEHEPIAASPCGTGLATTLDHLHQSFRTAVVALRLCAPPTTPSVAADRYGGLIGLLADTPPDAALPDVDTLNDVMTHAWGPATVDAVVSTGSIRHAARAAGVHHSTLHARVDVITNVMGFDPTDGIGRTRLGVAYLIWRLRTSRVLDLPAPKSTRQV